MAVQRINPGPRMSQAVVHGNKILAKIDGLLAKAGSDKSKLLSANIWLTDIKTWSQMNEVWDAWVAPGNTPARATVEAKLAAPGLVVEIMVQAAI
jgi:enamine deaminase RidA (YjgF/YER057c/UK114 family)